MVPSTHLVIESPSSSFFTCLKMHALPKAALALTVYGHPHVPKKGQNLETMLYTRVALLFTLLGLAVATPSSEAVAEGASEALTAGVDDFVPPKVDVARRLDDFVADILRLETEGAVGSAEAKCVDEAETAKAICTQRVVDKYNPDSSTAVVNKSPDHHFKALEFMMTDAILDKEEEMEELMREEYEDFDDDGPDSEDANNEISSLRRSSRQMSKKKKKGSVWGKKRKKMTPLEKKKRKMYVAPASVTHQRRSTRSHTVITHLPHTHSGTSHGPSVPERPRMCMRTASSLDLSRRSTRIHRACQLI